MQASNVVSLVTFSSTNREKPSSLFVARRTSADALSFSDNLCFAPHEACGMSFWKNTDSNQWERKLCVESPAGRQSAMLVINFDNAEISSATVTLPNGEVIGRHGRFN